MDGLLAVCLPKSGTNLVGALLRRIGYAVTGDGIDNEPPTWCASFDREFIRRFPSDTCYVLHSLSASGLDWEVTQSWRKRGVPKVLFNYRDPRAALVSMINYLVGGRYSGASWQQIGGDILCSLPEAERIEFGMDYFEAFIFAKYRESAWLLRHPKVLCCAFEKLIGPEGGGDGAEQVNEVSRVVRFAGAMAEPDEIAQNVFDRRARTFFKGSSDAWKSAFTASSLAGFSRRYGDILAAYGYR